MPRACLQRLALELPLFLVGIEDTLNVNATRPAAQLDTSIAVQMQLIENQPDGEFRLVDLHRREQRRKMQRGRATGPASRGRRRGSESVKQVGVDRVPRKHAVVHLSDFDSARIAEFHVISQRKIAPPLRDCH